MEQLTPPPWYRQFWPWFLMALPATVVVAGLTTWWIAASGADALVADDYYKEGLAINRVLHRQELARQLAVAAQVKLVDGYVEVVLEGNTDPSAMSLSLYHPLDAEQDRSISLARILPGEYRGELPLDSGSRWVWQLEPLGLAPDATWRLDGELRVTDAEVR